MCLWEDCCIFLSYKPVEKWYNKVEFSNFATCDSLLYKIFLIADLTFTSVSTRLALSSLTRISSEKCPKEDKRICKLIDSPSAALLASRHTAADSKRSLYLTRERFVAHGTNHRRLLEWDPLARHYWDLALLYYLRDALPVMRQLRMTHVSIESSSFTEKHREKGSYLNSECHALHLRPEFSVWREERLQKPSRPILHSLLPFA